MRRATITIPDDLEAQLNAYLAAQEAPPSLAALVQAALRRYLREQRLKERQYQPHGDRCASPRRPRGAD